MIKCGNCREYHGTVAEVRACCAGRRVVQQTLERPVRLDRHPVTEPGMYVRDGAIYKVQQAVHGSGRLYAKILVHTDEGQRDRFEYAKGAIYDLAAEDRLTLEAAKAYGALYGTCCVCGALLTNEDSIEAGIGPVCAGRL